MVEILAQAAEPAAGSSPWIIYVLVTALVGVTTGGGVLGYRQRRKNGNGGVFNKALCDERHKRIDEDMRELKDDIRDGFNGVHARLDNLRDIPPRKPRLRT